MITDHIHPEALLDRARQGQLSTSDARLLQNHLTECPACRVEHDVSPSLYHHVVLGGADQAMLDRLITASLRRAGQPRAARRPALAAAAVMAAVLAGAAASWAGAQVWQARSTRIIVEPLARPAAPVAVAPRRAVSVGVVAPPAEAPATAPADHPLIHVKTVAIKADQHHCPDLYRRANEERRRGVTGAALSLYQGLHRDCRGSSEDLSARVLVGRLYLDRLSDPTRALEAFDTYLQSATRGTLREDAMIGRALALAGLNATAKERQAWQDLIDAYPDSLYVQQARARLAQLQSPGR